MSLRIRWLRLFSVPIFALAPMLVGGFIFAAPVAAAAPSTRIATTTTSGPCALTLGRSWAVKSANTGGVELVVYVRCTSTYSFQNVLLSAAQFNPVCNEIEWFSDSNGREGSSTTYTVTLDGNANVWANLELDGCASVTKEIDATIQSPPMTTARALFTIKDAQTFATGLVALPQSITMTTPTKTGTTDTTHDFAVQFPASNGGQNVTFTTFQNCTSFIWFGPDSVPDTTAGTTFTVPLDSKGRAMVGLNGFGCVRGTNEVDAQLQVPPFTNLVVHVSDN